MVSAAPGIPPEYASGEDDFAPVPNIEHLKPAPVKELESLVLNITMPPAGTPGPLPVIVWIHGGAFVFGGANHAGYDCTRLVSYSVARDTPVVIVTFNYRVGLGGFLASKDIQNDLAKDGHSGIGNFGLYDQQLALAWVQKYIANVQGDKDNVTIMGESAGGVSVALQIAAKNPAVFHRAVAMSGNLTTIRPWSPEVHEKRYQALLRYLKIDPQAPDALEQLRKVPEDKVTAATIPIEGGHYFTFQNPCDDGVFSALPLTMKSLGVYPDWLKAIMVGEVRDEGALWRWQLAEDTYEHFVERFSKYMPKEKAEKVLALYGLTAEAPREEACPRFEQLVADAAFKAHNWLAAHKSNLERTYGYHVDEASIMDNPLKGLAYHAIDLLYLFLTRAHDMPEHQLRITYKLAGDFIDFAYGREPWERFGEKQRWMVYGDGEGIAAMKTEEEDEKVRGYSRMKQIEDWGMSDVVLAATEDVAMKTYKLGTTC